MNYELAIQIPAHGDQPLTNMLIDGSKEFHEKKLLDLINNSGAFGISSSLSEVAKEMFKEGAFEHVLVILYEMYYESILKIYDAKVSCRLREGTW